MEKHEHRSTAPENKQSRKQGGWFRGLQGNAFQEDGF